LTSAVGALVVKENGRSPHVVVSPMVRLVVGKKVDPTYLGWVGAGKKVSLTYLGLGFVGK
jgi:hypothetical protein